MRKKLIVIHGLGASFTESIGKLRGILDVEVAYERGVFRVDRAHGLILRRLLREADRGGWLEPFQKLFIARMLDGCFGNTAIDAKRALEFHESRLLTEFSHFGIPLTPAARQRRAKQLAEEGHAELATVMPVLEELEEAFRCKDGSAVTEPEARAMIREREEALGGSVDLQELLETVRDMAETGGDLDTVSSAVLYTHWLVSKAAEQGKTFLYGRDYRYVFVNYHEGLRHLAELGPADILMADFPIGALPDFEADVRFLHEHDVRIERFEDHHPYSREHLATFDKLKDEGLLEYVALSGACLDEGDDEPEGEPSCGADMVYTSTVSGEPWDCDGARELRKAAHSEDFVTDRYDLGMTLTQLIKGGLNKVELVQALAAAIPSGDLPGLLEKSGWKALTEAWEEQFAEIAEVLLDHAYLLQVKRPEGSQADLGGKSLGVGSDAPIPLPRSPRPDAPAADADQAPRDTAEDDTEPPSLPEDVEEGDAAPQPPSTEPETGECTTIADAGTPPSNDETNTSEPDTEAILPPPLHEHDNLTILMAHAYRPKPGEPKVPTGRAVQFFVTKFPDLDYIFYCFGSSLLVARRVNQADLSLNLGTLMGKIGGEGDGGHAGAAVGRPSSNASYPTKLLGDVHRGNFRQFVHYMKHRLNAEGLTVRRVQDRSTPASSERGNTKKILWALAAAFLAGLLLALVNPGFRRDEIEKSNADFFPQIQTAPANGPDEPGDEP